MRPPAAKNARITSAQLARAGGSLPTLKVIQLPSPTSGIASPLEGIGRVRTALVCAAAGMIAAAPAAANERSSARRFMAYGMSCAPTAVV